MLNSVCPYEPAARSLGGIRREFVFKNPVIAASGTFGYGEEFARFVDLKRIGAIVVKGTSARANRRESAAPALSHTVRNAQFHRSRECRSRCVHPRQNAFLREVGCTVFVNVFGFAEDEYVEVVDKLNDCEGIAAYELNISCPNTKHGGMMFGTNPQLTHSLTKMLEGRSKRPLIVKLSPNVTDIAEIARAAEDGGADALTVANTYLAMAIDTDTFKPRIHNVTGGLSGPAIRPITLRMVYQCARAVKIPVIGLGGIFTAEDAVEYFLAGASAVQIGTANFQDPRAPLHVLDGLEKFLEKRGMSSVKDRYGKDETMKEKICLVLDVSSRKEAMDLVRPLHDPAGMFKVGMQLFTAEGPSLVREIIEAGGKVFLDLKFHDIPNTVTMLRRRRQSSAFR